MKFGSKITDLTFLFAIHAQKWKKNCTYVLGEREIQRQGEACSMTQ